jgi:hypothetical protein
MVPSGESVKITSLAKAKWFGGPRVALTPRKHTNSQEWVSDCSSSQTKITESSALRLVFSTLKFVLSLD